jgi:hypothetical protein
MEHPIENWFHHIEKMFRVAGLIAVDYRLQKSRRLFQTIISSAILLPVEVIRLKKGI